MANWDENNRACTTLWTTLFTMHELVTNFSDSGDLTIKDLTFFNPLSSDNARRITANIIADHLDIVFTMGRGAVYEEGIDRNTAVTSMVEVLIDGDKSVSDLAEIADNCYIFWRERA